MTRNEFAAICGEYLIGIGIALENETVCNAIANGPEAVREALEEEF